MQFQKGLGKWMSDRIGSGYWEKLGHALALTPEVRWSSWSFGAFRSYPLELLWATMCEPRIWPSLGIFVLLASQEPSATLMGHGAPPTLMFHSPPHMVRYKVEFLAAAAYFKATFQVSVLGFLRILAALGCAISVMFLVLGRSLIVPSAWFSGLPECGSQSVHLFHAFGVMPAFPDIRHLLRQWQSCTVLCALLLTCFYIFPQRHSDVNRTSTLAPFVQTHHVSTVRNA